MAPAAPSAARGADDRACGTKVWHRATFGRSQAIEPALILDRAPRDHYIGRIFSFDERAAAAYGDLAAEAERGGTSINVADGQIAAIAKTQQMSVATRDVNDFEVMGVRLVNTRNFIMLEPAPAVES